MPCNTANKNLLQASKFQLVFDRLPDMSFFCQTASIPGIHLPENIRSTPFVDMKQAGDKIIFDTLEISFLVNENLSPWKEVFAWIQGLGFPETFDQYNNLANLRPSNAIGNIIPSDLSPPQYSDGNLTIYSNKNNPLVTVSFKDLFPTALSSIDLDVRSSAGEQVTTASASFLYSYYDLK